MKSRTPIAITAGLALGGGFWAYTGNWLFIPLALGLSLTIDAVEAWWVHERDKLRFRMDTELERERYRKQMNEG